MEYSSVPKIISCKDLDYLSDMFNWNYAAYKNTFNAINMVNDIEIKKMVIRASEMFYANMNSIIGILTNEVNNG